MSQVVRATLIGFLSLTPLGCSFFRPARTTAADPVAADTVQVQAVPADSTMAAGPSPTPVDEVPAPAPELPPPPAEKQPAPQERQENDGPVLTVRMTAEEETALRAQIASDTEKAHEALALVRRYPLTSQQADNLGLAEDFLKGALAARSTDLVRSSTLAEKARVLAMDLKSEVVK